MRIARWSRDRQRGICWIDIHRRHIKLKPRMRLFEIKTTHAFHVAEKWNQLELDSHPVAPLSFAQHELLTLYSDLTHGFQWIDRDRKRLGGCRRSLPECVRGSDQIGDDARILNLNGNDLPAFDRTRRRRRIVRVKRKCPVSSAQVGSPHAR